MSDEMPEPRHLSLGDLITVLESHHPAKVVPLGFARPHSYRGFYDELAFEPANYVTVAGMLQAARSALGATYQGWKGGDYTMNEYTPVWLAERGSTGEGLGAVLVHLLLNAVFAPSPPPTTEPTERGA